MNARGQSPPASRHQALASVPSGLNVLAGIWLMVSAVVLDHGGTVAGLDTRWVDLTIGFAIVLVALTRAISPRAVARTGWVVNVVLGTWLVVAPLVLDYGSRAVVVNDVVVGAVVVVLTCASLALTKRARPNLDMDRQVGDSARFE
ncbi:hypothetical protein [Lentzea sp. NPDC003310]|uniref:SPW repeat domain-containing protein n=1 Tax=Lentzea sp. NPDC003310 TaxID=3154447 RepID=UPI00339FA9BB